MIDERLLGGLRVHGTIVARTPAFGPLFSTPGVPGLGCRAVALPGLSLLQNRYPALHGLRFVAIVSVLQVHVTVTLHGFKLMQNGELAGLSQSVWFGMDLFFVLSGFLIGSMLLHQGGTGMGRFWLRRAFRTFASTTSCSPRSCSAPSAAPGRPPRCSASTSTSPTTWIARAR